LTRRNKTDDHHQDLSTYFSCQKLPLLSIFIEL
jgi:hypothetical protein